MDRVKTMVVSGLLLAVYLRRKYAMKRRLYLIIAGLLVLLMPATGWPQASTDHSEIAVDKDVSPSRRHPD